MFSLLSFFWISLLVHALGCGPISFPSLLQALAQCTKVEGFSSLAARSSLRLYPDGLGVWVELDGETL